MALIDFGWALMPPKPTRRRIVWEFQFYRRDSAWGVQMPPGVTLRCYGLYGSKGVFYEGCKRAPGRLLKVFGQTTVYRYWYAVFDKTTAPHEEVATIIALLRLT